MARRSLCASFGAVCLIASVAALIPSHLNAQILETAGIAAKAGATTLAGVTVRDLITEARQQATTLLADGRSTGDTLIARAGDELNMFADNAVRLVGDELDAKLEGFDETTRNLLISLHAATQSAKSFTKKAYDIKDTAALDLRSILGGLPLVKEHLVLQRVDGLTHLKGASDYPMELIGSYIGTPSEEHTSAISVRINGTTIEGLRITPVGLHHAALAIPNSEVSQLFDEEQLRILPGVIVISQRFKEGWWIFKSWKEKKYEVPVHFSLFPPYAGTVKVVARTQEMGWVRAEPKSNTATGGTNHCGKNCNGHRGSPYEVGTSVSGGERVLQHVGDQRIVGISECRCISGTCAFDEHNHSLVDLNKTRARCGWQGRSHPSTWRITAQVEQWVPIGERDIEQSVKIYWDRNVEIRVPLNSSTVRVSGRLLTGQDLDILDGQPDPSGLLTRIRKVLNVNDASLYYRISRPKGF